MTPFLLFVEILMGIPDGPVFSTYPVSSSACEGAMVMADESTFIILPEATEAWRGCWSIEEAPSAPEERAIIMTMDKMQTLFTLAILFNINTERRPLSPLR